MWWGMITAGKLRGLIHQRGSGDGKWMGYFKTLDLCSQGHSSFITHLDWSKDGNFIMSNSGDYEILYCEWQWSRTWGEGNWSGFYVGGFLEVLSDKGVEIGLKWSWNYT